MAVLVTRPQPDNEATAAALRVKGVAVLLAPMLRFEPIAFHDDADARYGAIIVNLKKVDRSTLSALVGEAWRMKATAALRKAYDLSVGAKR